MPAFTPEQEQRLREIVREELHRAVSAGARRAKRVFVTLAEKGPEITFMPLASRGRPKVKRVAPPKAGG